MRKTVKRFFKYSAVGFSTFILDLVLLYILTSFLSINYLIGTAIAFIIAVSLNYVLSRKYVFRKTTEKINISYLRFVSIAIFGLLIIVSSMFISVEIYNNNYIVSRVIIACVVGFLNYLFNLHLNFKVVNNH